jgi:hypothetical protein
MTFIRNHGGVSSEKLRTEWTPVFIGFLLLKTSNVGYKDRSLDLLLLSPQTQWEIFSQ